MLFDFVCGTCGHEFEELVQPGVNVVDCPKCRGAAIRQISTGHLDWKMGVTNDFPTAARKWEKIQRQKAKVDKGGRADGAPNLKMY
jgi:putative FmdB family regulatory protein